MKLTLARKLYAIVGILMVVIIIGTASAYFSLTYAVNNLKRLTNDVRTIEGANNDIEVKLGLAVEVSRNYLIRTGDKYIDKFHGFVADIRKQLGVYERFAEDEQEKNALSRSKELLVSFEQSINELVEARRKSNDIAAVDDEVTISASPLRAAMKQLNEMLMNKFDDRTKRLESVISKLEIILVIAALLSCVFAIVVSTMMIRKILEYVHGVAAVTKLAANGDLSQSAPVKSDDEIGEMAKGFNTMMENLRRMIGNINDVTNTVANSSSELSTTVHHITTRVDEQSGKTTQVATSSAEMSQTVLDIARNASNIASSATDTLRVAREGEEVVSKTVQEVQEIARTVSDSSGLMSSLGTRSKQIGEIVGVIKDIADQTNLLALNAAIEAARAGEQGRGFAVVADEVRKLAERTTKATAEISGMITAIQEETERALAGMDESLKKVESGASLSREAGEALHKILKSVDDLQSMVQQIASATEEMSAVSEGINSDIEAIAALAHETSTDANKIASESTDLSKLAEELRSTTNQFRL
ncbi:MAG: methyl-accepting chemotaxis protein [Nitrospirota bacterium]